MTRYYKGDEQVEAISSSEVDEVYDVYDIENIVGGRTATPTFIIIMKENSELKFAVGYGEFENENPQDTGEELEKTLEYAKLRYW